MAGTQDRNVIIDRYNHACSAYQSAASALKRGSAEQYEAGLVDAAQAVWSALEWAVRFHLEHDCIQQLNEQDLQKLKKAQFPAWVELLGKLNPPVDEMTRRQLIQHRALRNDSTHDGVLPAHRTVLAALESVRRFLMQRLLVSAEQLLVAVADEPPPADRPQGDTAQGPVIGDHRKLGLTAWIEQTIAQGIARARSRRGGRYDATLDSLALEAKRLLTRDAVALCMSGNGPDAPLFASEASIEEETQRLLWGGSAAGLDAERLSRLRHLVPLLQRRTSLCVEADWFKTDGEHVVFASPGLAVMLVGAAIMSPVSESHALRLLAGQKLSWAEAGWAAVSAGDDVNQWASLLLQTLPSPALVSRVVATAAAFGAAPINAVATDTLAAAFRLCVLSLIWFSPVRTDAFDKVIERESPWYLPVGVWHRAILDLAHISSLLGRDNRLLLDASDIDQPPEPLCTIIKAMGLHLRLTAAQARAVQTLCAPYQAAQAGRIDEPFFGAVFTGDTRMLSASDFMSFWLKSYAIPAMSGWDKKEAARLLAMPGPTRPAGFLLHHLELHEEWADAWRVLAQQGVADDVVSAWVEALQFVAHRSDDKTIAMVQSGFQTLADMGLEAEVRKRIRESLKPFHTDSKESPDRHSVRVEILRRTLVTPDDFEKIVVEWTEEAALAWRTLLTAGAPDDAIARWCVAKLVACANAPQAYQDGPIGVVVSSGFEAISTGEGQLAFKQAREALHWLLEHGSAAAILVIANACTPEEQSPPTVDPIMRKMPGTGLSIPLSQAIWGMVVHRPEGRGALYALVEGGKVPESPMFLKGKALPGSEESLWMHVAGLICQSLIQSPPRKDVDGSNVPRVPASPSAQERAEAERLLACFELRLQKDPWLAWLNRRPVRAAIVAYTAICGADSTVPLAALIDELMKDSGTRKWLSNACLLIGVALRQLARHHAERTRSLLESALSPKLLAAMMRDDTGEFWIALLEFHGPQRVRDALEKQEVRDLGLGFFDALQYIDERVLFEWHLQPAMMRSSLLRAAEQRFSPSDAFWQEAWSTERSPDEVPELVLFLDGPWLTQLLEKSRAWSRDARIKLVRHMALYAAAAEVRQRCLTALYTMEPEKFAGAEPQPL